MKRIIFPKFSKIALIISSALLGIYVLIKILEANNIYIFLLGYDTQKIIPLITVPCVALLVSAAAVLCYKNIRRKILVVLITIVASFFIFSYMLVDYAFSPTSRFFEYTSDDENHNIVVKEMSFLLSGGGVIYEKTSWCTMERVGGYITDDGFCPLTNDAFFFVWNEDDFELHYSFFGSLDEKYRVVEMEYAK